MAQLDGRLNTAADFAEGDVFDAIKSASHPGTAVYIAQAGGFVPVGGLARLCMYDFPIEMEFHLVPINELTFNTYDEAEKWRFTEAMRGKQMVAYLAATAWLQVVGPELEVQRKLALKGQLAEKFDSSEVAFKLYQKVGGPERKITPLLLAATKKFIEHKAKVPEAEWSKHQKDVYAEMLLGEKSPRSAWAEAFAPKRASSTKKKEKKEEKGDEPVDPWEPLQFTPEMLEYIKNFNGPDLVGFTGMVSLKIVDGQIDWPLLTIISDDLLSQALSAHVEMTEALRQMHPGGPGSPTAEPPQPRAASPETVSKMSDQSGDDEELKEYAANDAGLDNDHEMGVGAWSCDGV